MKQPEKLCKLCVCCMEGFLLGIHMACGLASSIIRVESCVATALLLSVLPVLACKSHGQLHGRLINIYFLIFHIIQCNPNNRKLGGESPSLHAGTVMKCM